MKSPIPCLLLVLATLLAFGGLTACGQKGDLYLPDKPAPAQKQR